MGRKSSNMLYSILIGLLLIVVFVLYTGVELTIANEYLRLLPYLFVVLIGVYGAKSTRGIAGIGSYALLGVGFALLCYELNTLGFPWVTDLLSLTFTIQYLEALIVALFTILGTVLNMD